ncbi:EAL domain-containing protein [Roseateles sp. So40a]|uniref:EAL domain-containing protein n=1 Tax=Roseateles sp. So40a TaxID=3400226 RepID=UPI003A8B4236
MSDLAELDVASLAPEALTLHTAFQPVFSLTHGRLVGHEALLRAQGADGRPAPPSELFTAITTPASLAALDARAVRQHLSAYVSAGKREAAEWLLLNLHPVSLLPDTGALDDIVLAIEESGLRPSRIVIEVLESPLFEDDRVYPALQRLRDLGCLIALDDFGAGHSNFERIFDLRPHLVKLDRRVLLRAKGDARARRILQRMVSLIQECGALVLIEGVETLAGAHVALTCDADFVQGYYFGRPAAEVLPAQGEHPPLLQAWDSFDEGQSRADDRWRESMGAHCDDLRLASIQLAAGASVATACAGFLAADGATMCYLLDDRGHQIEEVAFRDDGMRRRLGGTEQFEPLRDCAGARWSRRQYFRRAVSFPGAVQLTRPYLTLQGGWMCLTASIAFEIEGRRVILCGDLRIDPTEAAA